MTEVEQLQAQIEELKKTVDDLKSGCLKVETDRQKLSRLREEIRNSVIPEEARVRISGNGYGHSRFVQNIGIVANEAFFLSTTYKYKSYQHMDKIIFGHEDSKERLKIYLEIYKETCEFLAGQYLKWNNTSNEREDEHHEKV